ncbi:MAG: hypothetical protein AAGI53_04555 [Planctomycetota bacterium]
MGRAAELTPYEILWWELLEDVTAVLCYYIGGCDAAPWLTTNASIEARMQAQYDEYEANGIGSLTTQEESDLYNSAVDAKKHLQDNPGGVDADLEADYLNMLSEIIEELQP